jgi:uncharacterized protein involved in type VI secretion and phage assembly
MEGVVEGIVTSVDDPDEQGRVKLHFPWLAEKAESGWAPVVRPLAGKDRGFYYMPEIDDEVLVAFAHGDVNHPMVLGFLHNGVDQPPFGGIDAHVRRLKTVSGHVLEFDDRAGKESIRLHTNDGHQLELHDPDGYIELVTHGGQTIKMSDDSSDIELSTSLGVSITIGPVGVTVTAPLGPVTVNSLQAQVNAMATASVRAAAVTVEAAALAVNAAMAVFSGVVQCQTLMTTSVVSATYTPGIGNLL